MTLATRDALDLIDQAFIGRCALETTRAPHEARVAAAAVPPGPIDLPPSAPLPVSMQPVSMQPISRQLKDPLLAQLLAAVPDQWLQVVEQIENALAAGCRVFAFTAGRPGEGCTTVARGAFHALCGRGHRVACVTRPPLQGRAPEACDREVDQADIVIVDAGTWFPSGPIRRRQVAQQAFGCDAAILVRRADRPPCAAHGETLAAIGLRVLGEVITFTSAHREEVTEQPHD